jgi:hypothetical protein
LGFSPQTPWQPLHTWKPWVPLPPREHPYSRRPVLGRTQAVPVTPSPLGQRRATGVTWCGQAPRWDSLILPVPLAKISRPPPNPTRIPRSGEKWLICANCTEIDLAHLLHIACAHIAGSVSPIQTQAVGWGVNEKALSKLLSAL